MHKQMFFRQKLIMDSQLYKLIVHDYLLAEKHLLVSGNHFLTPTNSVLNKYYLSSNIINLLFGIS